MEAKTLYQLIKDKIIRIPEYTECTMLQQTFLTISTAQTLQDQENNTQILKAIGESLGVKFKEKK